MAKLADSSSANSTPQGPPLRCRFWSSRTTSATSWRAAGEEQREGYRIGLKWAHVRRYVTPRCGPIISSYWPPANPTHGNMMTIRTFHESHSKTKNITSIFFDVYAVSKNRL